MEKQNAPGRKAEGVVCLLAGDTDAYATTSLRRQYLNRLGVPFHRASMLASFCFGEGALS